MADPFKLIIEDDEGKRNVVPIDLGEVTVGRLEGNAIRLNERNVSRTHMRLVKEAGNVFAEDLDSYNGVFINGERITHRQAIHEGDLIRVGDFHLELRGEGLTRRSEETTQKTLLPDLDSTQPEIRVPGEQTDINIQMPGPYEETPPPQPMPTRPGADDEETERAEPTAIIRMDHLQSLDADKGRRPSGTLAGLKPRLLCVATQFAGQEFEINKAEAVIGRTSDNDVQVDHRSVSRHHAKIVVAANSYKIVDLGSANGTLVNGEQYAQLALKSGDLIELGHVKFRFIPPGQSYSPNAEEIAAIQSKGTAAGALSLDESAARAQGLLDQARANPMMLIATISFVLALVVLGGWLVTSGDDPDAADDGEVETMAKGTPAEKFIVKAEEFADRRQWRKAIRLLELAIEADTENEKAMNLLERYEQEIEFKRRYEAANKAIKSSTWEEAWNYLSSIDRQSAYWEDAERLRPQVIGALATERITEIKQLIDNGKAEEAAGLLDELKAINPENPQIAEIEKSLQDAGVDTEAVEDGDGKPRGRNGRPPRDTVGAVVDSGRPKATPTKAKARTKTTGTAPPPPPPSTGSPPPPEETPPPQPAAAAAAAPVSGDAKTLYTAGIAALQAGDTKKAIDNFAKCVQVDRTHCLCYRAMGIAYARAGNGPKAARYYRLYLRYCPTAKDADQVKKLLEAYGG